MRLFAGGGVFPAGGCWLVTSHSPIQKSKSRCAPAWQDAPGDGGGDGGAGEAAWTSAKSRRAATSMAISVSPPAGSLAQRGDGDGVTTTVSLRSGGAGAATAAPAGCTTTVSLRSGKV